MTDVTVEAYPRLHVTLGDLGRATGRAYGGCGFVISGPPLRLAGRQAQALELRGFDRLDERARRDVQSALNRLGDLHGIEPAIELILEASFPQHVGLGSKTALVLAALSVARQLLALDTSDEVLQRLSGRGGASGVGVHGYFSGSFVLDLGHPQEAVPDLRPSSDRVAQDPPALLTALPIPTNWRFRLLLPDGKRIADGAEVEFFQNATPTAMDEAYRTLAYVLHGVAAAVATGDLDLLREALIAIHDSGFKAAELAAQSAPVRQLVQRAQAIGCAGLSSLGPLVYVLYANDDESQRHRFDRLVEELDVRDLGEYVPQNAGARLVLS